MWSSRLSTVSSVRRVLCALKFTSYIVCVRAKPRICIKPNCSGDTKNIQLSYFGDVLFTFSACKPSFNKLSSSESSEHKFVSKLPKNSTFVTYEVLHLRVCPCKTSYVPMIQQAQQLYHLFSMQNFLSSKAYLVIQFKLNYFMIVQLSTVFLILLLTHQL